MNATAETTVSSPAANSVTDKKQIDLSTLSAEQKLLLYRPYVFSIATRFARYLPPQVQYADLVSAGMLGLWDAVLKYQEEKKVQFTYYVGFRIRGAMYDELRKMAPYSRRTMTFIKHVKEARGRVEQKMMREATDKEIIAEMGITSAEYYYRKKTAPFIVWVDLDKDHNDSGDALCLHDTISSDATLEKSHDEIYSEERYGAVIAEINKLPDRERAIMNLYYLKNMKLYEIAERFNLTESRICQIHAQTLKLIRERLNRDDEWSGR